MRKLIFGGVILLISVFATNYIYAQRPPTSRSFKQEFLNYINTKRQQGCNCGTKWMPPAQPLIWNNLLQKAAYSHAKDMNDKNYFSHTSKDGRSMQDRIVFAGYIYNGFKSFTCGENIAMGQQSIEQVMDEWFKSEGHCHNLMNANFKEIGIAEYNDYWVQDFGGRESWSPAEQKALLNGNAKVVLQKRDGH